VVAGGGDEVLQLRRGEGVRNLQEISGIGSSGRSSPGSGGRRRCSARIREGEGAVGGRRRRSGCRERWGGLGAREEGSEMSGDRGTSGAARARSERLRGSAAEGKEEGKSGVPGCGGATRRGGAMGLGPDWRTAPDSGLSEALTGDVRCARVPAGQSEGERRLTGGPRHSAGQ
jgi:hypothetical protein